jgi:hypothetical protein
VGCQESRGGHGPSLILEDAITIECDSGTDRRGVKDGRPEKGN